MLIYKFVNSFQTLRNATDVNKPIDKQYCDAVVNFLLRIACQVRKSSSPSIGLGVCSKGEQEEGLLILRRLYEK